MGNPNWKPGVSGNPNGRPIKSRALTAILEAAGDKKVTIGKKKTPQARKEIMAEMVWQIITEGKATLPNGKVLKIAANDWLETWKFLYKHVDGPPVAGLDVTSLGEQVGVISVIEHDDGDQA
jgi:hypothetical protein